MNKAPNFKPFYMVLARLKIPRKRVFSFGSFAVDKQKNEYKACLFLVFL